MRTPRRITTARAEAPPPPPARGRRAHAGPPADEGPHPLGESAPDTAPAHAGHRFGGPRTVRSKIICLLMVPVVSLLALWAYATVTTAQDVSRLRQVQRVDAAVRAPPPSPPSRPNARPRCAVPPTPRRYAPTS